MGSEMFTKAQEKMRIKSNIARTCNRFSQFLKERRSLGDIGFGSITSPRLDMEGGTYSLCPTQIQTKPNGKEEQQNVNELISVEDASLELFPLTSSSSSLNLHESAKNTEHSRESTKLKEEPKKRTKAPMTIIYEGKVIVLEDLHEEMAKEIITLASQGGVINESSNNNPITTHFSRGLLDLPIARRTSLHRFMDKRKDRKHVYATVTLAEFRGSWFGLKLARRIGVRQLIVESDSKIVVNLVNGNTEDNLTYDSLINDCKRLLADGDEYVLRHVYRETIFCADKFSNLALGFPLGDHELHAPPHGFSL